MLTVSLLARSCGLSRATVLYYESIGLLKPPPRTAGNYRHYGKQDLERLRQICVYRSAGLRLEDIRQLLSGPQDDASEILKRRLTELSGEIDRLREQQGAIVRLLKKGKSFRRYKAMNKEKWVSIMRAAGFSEDDMHRWHVEFERSAPEDHQRFLEFLHIPQEEIASIRDWSRKTAAS